MSHSYFSSYSDAAQRPTPQPGRPNYYPPHLRNNNNNTFPDQAGRGGGRGGFTPGRGFFPRTVTNPNNTNYIKISDRFSSLSLSDQQNTNPNPDKNVKISDNNIKISDNLKTNLKLPENQNPDTNKSNGINFEAYEDIPVEITGTAVPKPVNTFAEIDLGHVLKDNVVNRCKYVKPTPIQRHAIPVVLAGRDLMACAQTGSGKTAAFCFPIICGVLKTQTTSLSGSGLYGGRREMVAYPLALILSPTRELCCQIFEEAKKFCFNTGVKVAVAYGGAPVYNQLRSFERGVDILVATPGRLTDLIERSRISLKKIKYLALDEADRMLDMGFEPQIRKIVERLDMPRPGLRQTMLFSATFPSEIQKMASDFLQNYIFLSVGRVGSSTDLIVQQVVFVEDSEKQEYLRNLLHDQRAKGNIGKNALTLIFVETKRSADLLENWLCRMNFPAAAIHGDKVQFERERALRSFKNGVTSILVATDVASRGLDIPHVAHVINYDLPRDIDSYVHRIGRTGRAGKSGVATGFFNDKNSNIAKAISELMKEAHQEAPDWLNQYAESYSSSSDYRHGSSKFGGRDFRSKNGSSYGSADYGASADYGVGADYGADAYYGAGADYGGTSYDYASQPVAADFSDSYGGGGGGYASVVASGWD